MAKVYFKNGNVNSAADEVAMSSDIKYLAQDSSSDQVAIGNTLEWVNLPAANANWTSTAQIAYITPNLIAMRGSFTSATDTNTDPMAAFPFGYKPASFYKIVPSTITATPSVLLVADSTLGSYGELSTTTEASTGDVVNVDLFFVANEDQLINA